MSPHTHTTLAAMAAARGVGVGIDTTPRGGIAVVERRRGRGAGARLADGFAGHGIVVVHDADLGVLEGLGVTTPDTTALGGGAVAHSVAGPLTWRCGAGPLEGEPLAWVDTDAGAVPVVVRRPDGLVVIAGDIANDAACSHRQVRAFWCHLLAHGDPQISAHIGDAGATHRVPRARRHTAVRTARVTAGDVVVDPGPESEMCAVAASLVAKLGSSAVSALWDLRSSDTPTRPCVVVLDGFPFGDLGDTPVDARTARRERPPQVAAWMLTVARTLGEPVGYRSRNNGALVTDLVGETPQHGHVDELGWHTETADDNNHRSRFVLLGCLRNPDRVQTRVSDIRRALSMCSVAVCETLREPRFTFESTPGGEPAAVIGGSFNDPWVRYDDTRTRGVDPAATDAVDTLRAALGDTAVTITPEPGQIVVVDNLRCVHARDAFETRTDGSGRWMVRSYVTDSLERHHDRLDGRVIDDLGAGPGRGHS